MTADDPLRVRIEHDFDYHAPTGGKVQAHKDIRHLCRDVAHLLVDACPESRERSLALTKLEEVMFWANAAIARNSEKT